jgi:hypothetical protein
MLPLSSRIVNTGPCAGSASHCSAATQRPNAAQYAASCDGSPGSSHHQTALAIACNRPVADSGTRNPPTTAPTGPAHHRERRSRAPDRHPPPSTSRPSDLPGPWHRKRRVIVKAEHNAISNYAVAQAEDPFSFMAGSNTFTDTFSGISLTPLDGKYAGYQATTESTIPGLEDLYSMTVLASGAELALRPPHRLPRQPPSRARRHFDRRQPPLFVLGRRGDCSHDVSLCRSIHGQFVGALRLLRDKRELRLCRTQARHARLRAPRDDPDSGLHQAKVDSPLASMMCIINQWPLATAIRPDRTKADQSRSGHSDK